MVKDFSIQFSSIYLPLKYLTIIFRHPVYIDFSTQNGYIYHNFLCSKIFLNIEYKLIFNHYYFGNSLKYKRGLNLYYFLYYQKR